MTYILNIESSTNVCSVSLAKDGELLGAKESFENQNHAKLTGVYTKQLLQEHKLEPSQLSAIAVSEGPGSYTGLRIGCSHAKGMCYALGIPLITISPLQSMCKQALGVIDAKDYKDSTLLIPMLDARRMEVYTCSYNLNLEKQDEVVAKVIDEDSFVDIDINKQLIVFGNGASKCKEVIKRANMMYVDDIYCSAKDMAFLSYQAFQKEDFADVAYFEPFYLKDFIAGTPKKTVLDL